MAKTLKSLKAELLQAPEVREAYEAMRPEFEIARAIIEARTASGLTQEDLAARMGTSQSYIAKLESGRTLPTMRTWFKIAEATGTRAVLRLETPA
jgi:predicted transcriptional regulator